MGTEQTYILIEAGTTHDLSRKVSTYLSEGWVLYGNPLMTRWEYRTSGSNYNEEMWCFCQAVIKQRGLVDRSLKIERAILEHGDVHEYAT
jgi:hypothetical protein